MTLIFGNETDRPPCKWRHARRWSSSSRFSSFASPGDESFGQRSPFDAATTVLLGAVLSRGVVGASPFWATVAASAVLVLLHRLVGWISVRSDAFDTLVNGKERSIVVDGQKLDHAIAASLITDRALAEAVRKKFGEYDLARVRGATLERDCEISIFPKF
jgi:uncharacterized membrane protein YcaP (DUF421 family)